MVVKSSSHLVILSLAISLEFGISSVLPVTATSPSSWQQPLSSSKEVIAQRRRSRLRFKVPRISPSRKLEGGAARGNCNLDGGKKIQMQALLPNTNIGLTTAEKPTFFFQVSQTPVQEAKFILLNDQGDTIIYEKTFPLTKTGGVMSFTLPADADALEVGKEYSWEVVVNCDPVDQKGNPRVEGSIKRVQPNAELVSNLAKVPIRDRVDLYANQGYWYDSIKTLADLRRTNPNDPTLVNDWKDLLDSAGLNTLAQDPLLQCCTP